MSNLLQSALDLCGTSVVSSWNLPPGLGRIFLQWPFGSVDANDSSSCRMLRTTPRSHFMMLTDPVSGNRCIFRVNRWTGICKFRPVVNRVMEVPWF